MMKATPSQSHPDRCVYCGQLIYPTQTARGTEYAHIDSKVLFCTTEPVSARWQDTLRFLVEDCGLDAAGTETLVRLAATIADEVRLSKTANGTENDVYYASLSSFGEPNDVHALATGVGRRLYPDDQRA